jgi:putative colanic acid biosynthesis UDP-glucose lipid carrier transferase
MSYQHREQALYKEKARLVLIHPQESDSDFIRFRKISSPFKRLFDIIVSLFVIVFVLSWLLPVLGICIRLDSKGPVFFIQKRVGALGKIFYCIKLRTMVVNAEANVQQAQADDPRITSFGKFLRLSCMDELPQFFNVLIGDMSIVGPRPHMIRDCREFSKVVKHYGSRYSVRPGITGMAQVKGYRGKTRNFFDVSHRYKWDMFYVRNLSFSLDMRIVGLTITSTISSVYCNLIGRREKTEPANTYELDTPEYLN